MRDLVLLSCCLVAASLPAAETVDQIRLSGGTAPVISEVERDVKIVSLGSASGALDLQDGKGRSLGLGYERFCFPDAGSLGYGLYGGLFARSQDGRTSGGTQLAVRSLGVDLGIDGVWRPVGGVFVAAGPRLGVATARQEIDAPSYSDAQGLLLSIGLQGGIYATIGHVIVGAEGGYAAFRSEAMHDYDDGTFVGTEDDTFKGKGGNGALVLGYQF